uniref:ADP-ribosylation factor GTPase-activating protein 1-like isoform X1 n=3 Tax=Myxine glutinosa TaxID=7769 RepID=UPI00358ED6EC
MCQVGPRDLGALCFSSFTNLPPPLPYPTYPTLSSLLTVLQSMASPRTRRVLAESQAINGGNVCFECSAGNPHWASVTYGVWLCEECADQHRALGEGISIVRCSAENLAEHDLQRMLAGGNDNFREFLKLNVCDPSWTIQDKYHSFQAAAYRDKLSEKVSKWEGSMETSSLKSWTPTQPKLPFPTFSSSRETKLLRSNSATALEDLMPAGNDNCSSAFKLSLCGPQTTNLHFLHRSHGHGGQGKQYIGFGSSDAVEKEEEEEEELRNNTVSSLHSGWSSLATGASKFAAAAKEGAAKLGSQASLKLWKSKPQQAQGAGMKPWKDVTSLFSHKRSGREKLPKNNSPLLEQVGPVTSSDGDGGIGFDGWAKYEPLEQKDVLDPGSTSCDRNNSELGLARRVRASSDGWKPLESGSPPKEAVDQAWEAETWLAGLADNSKSKGSGWKKIGKTDETWDWNPIY